MYFQDPSRVVFNLFERTQQKTGYFWTFLNLPEL